MGILAGFESGLAFQIPLLVLVLLVGLIAPYAFASSRPKGFPPGPPTKPFVGNLHLIPTTKSFILYVEMHFLKPHLLTSGGSATGQKPMVPSWASNSGPPMS